MNQLKQPLRDWNRDIHTNMEDEYQSILRTLNLIDNFGLLFVRCSPAKGTHLIKRIRSDIKDKKLSILELEQPIDNLYSKIEEIYIKYPVEILFISGIENSFNEYIKSSYDGSSGFYLKDSVPRVLGHLNLQRERFRDNFKFCIVFLVRSYGLNYFIQRAPDFFDWRSGVFNYHQTEEEISLEIDEDFLKEVRMKSECQDQSIPQMIQESFTSYLAYQEVNNAR